MPRAVGVRQDDLGGLGLDVHRQVEQNRAGPAGQHLVPGPMEDERQLVDARRLPPLLHDRLEDAGIVRDMAALELLEEAGPRMYVCGEPVMSGTAVEST